MLNKLLLLSSIVFLSLITAHPVFALTSTATGSASATPSATPSVTPSQAEDIQEKIKALVKENLTATESTLQEKINQKILVGYVGTVKAINSGNLTLNTPDNALLQLTTDDQTVYLKASSPAKLTSLALGDRLIVIGTLLKEDIVLAKRLVYAPVDNDPDQMISGTIVAKISSLDIKKRTVGLIIDNTEVIYTLTKKSTIDLKTLSEGSTIFAITKKYQGRYYLSRAKTI